MVRKISAAELKRLKKSGATIRAKPKPIVAKAGSISEIDTSKSSDSMKAAIAAAQRAAEAANYTANKILATIKEGTGKNREILKDIKDAVDGNNNPVIKMKINRSKDKLMTDIDLIRKAN